MSTPTRRTLRGINADFVHTQLTVRRTALAGWYIIWFVGARGYFVGWMEIGGMHNGYWMIGASLLALLLLVMMCRWIFAGVALAVWSVFTSVWVIHEHASMFYVIYALLLGACGAFGVWNQRKLPKLQQEYADEWKPHQIQAGEVFTVRDGDAFSVVKVLAVEPDRVHVKQYALRYPDRPWHVKSSTLLHSKGNTGGKAFDHLPLDFEEFMRWAPVLLRAEPISPAELKPLETWRRLQL